MKTNLRHTIPALIISAGLMHLTSCESVLFIELDEADHMIVLNGAISDLAPVEVQVSRSRHILDNSPLLPLENATVRLFEGDRLVGELDYTDNAVFAADNFVPVPGGNYTIEVENQGYPAVRASCTLPAMVPIISVDTLGVDITHDDEYYYGWSESYLQFDLTLDDPAGVDNYYLLSATADRSYSEYRDTVVKVVDSLFYNNQWNYFLEDSAYMIEEIHRFVEYPGIMSEDIVAEEFTSHGILFSDQLFDGKEYSFSGKLWDNSLEAADSCLLDLQLLSISEDYYKYMKSRQRHYETKENYMAVPVMVFSNVEDGAGFLGGFTMDEHRLIVKIPVFSWDHYIYK